MPITSSRSSDRFAQLLDEVEGRRHRHRHRRAPAHLHHLLSLAAAVGTATAAPEPDEIFRSGLRDMLMATVDREGIGRTAHDRSGQTSAAPAQAARPALTAKQEPARPVRMSRAGQARAAAIAGVMVGAVALSGVSAASTSAVPGDTLYQVKRSAEQAQLAFAGSPQSRGRLHLEFAANRLREAAEVEQDRIGQTLADMDDQTLAGAELLATAAVAGDPTAIDAIQTFVAAQRGRLAAFATTTPAGADPMSRSLNLLTSVQQRADAITRALAAGCTFGAGDRYGPIPASPC